MVRVDENSSSGTSRPFNLLMRKMILKVLFCSSDSSTQAGMEDSMAPTSQGAEHREGERKCSSSSDEILS